MTNLFKKIFCVEHRFFTLSVVLSVAALGLLAAITWRVCFAATPIPRYQICSTGSTSEVFILDTVSGEVHCNAAFGAQRYGTFEEPDFSAIWHYGDEYGKLHLNMLENERMEKAKTKATFP